MSLIHAGPSSEKFGSALFSSFAPSDVKEYNTGFKIRQDVMCAILIINTFDELLASELKILLWHLAFLMHKCTASPAAQANKLSLRPHLPACPHHLDKFIKDVETLYGQCEQQKTSKLCNYINVLSERKGQMGLGVVGGQLSDNDNLSKNNNYKDKVGVFTAV